MPVRIEGMKEFRRELRKVDGTKSSKALKKVYRQVAQMEQRHARANATAAGGAFAKARTAIKGDQTIKSASLGISRSNRIPFAAATFWGTKKRSGWYARERYDQSRGQQHPEWVGNTWSVGSFTEGPYVINYTIAEDMDEIVGEFSKGLDEMFAEAFNQ